MVKWKRRKIIFSEKSQGTADDNPISLDNGLHNRRITPIVHLYSIQKLNVPDRTILRPLSTQLGLKSF